MITRFWLALALIATLTAQSSALSTQRVNLDVVDQPLTSVLARLGRAFGVSVGISQGFNGHVSVSLHQATFDEAFTAVLKPLGGEYARYGDVVIVKHNPQAKSAGPPTAPTVVRLSAIKAATAAELLRRLYPQARISVQSDSNSIVITASAADLEGMNRVLTGIDAKNPARPTAEAIPLHRADPAVVVERLHGLYPNAQISVGPNRSILVEAPPETLAQIKSIVAAVDPAPVHQSDVTQVATLDSSNSASVVSAVTHEFPNVRAAAIGSSVVLTGPPDSVAKAKTLVAQVDAPPADAASTQVYRINALDATSVAALLQRSFPGIHAEADTALNAVVVTGTKSQQEETAKAIAELDGPRIVGAEAAAPPPAVQPGEERAPVIAPNGTNVEVVTLKAATPAVNGAQSTSASDIANAVVQALGTTTPNLHITVPNNSTELVLTGPASEVRLAKQLIDQLDTTQKLVVLDTQILEVDENAARNLGLSLTQPVISTTYSEYLPTPGPNGSPPPFLGLLRFTRSPLSIGVTLNALIQSGKGRILSNPRIVTISGRTASIRSGDNISILTTAGGSAGTVATTQLQTFQTGVSLDITPIVNAGDYISVSLHPTVNSLSSVSNGIPQISTRDTQTTVGMKSGQTLIIGGLIQDNVTSSDQKIPILGDIPVIGKLFHDKQFNSDRNELVITVTPHVLDPGEGGQLPSSYQLRALPSAAPLPTIPASLTLPIQQNLTMSALEPGSTGHATLTSPPPTHAGPAAGPTPAAFAQANRFTYGSPPQSTFASFSAPPQIFYATLSPTVLSNGAPVTVSAITTANVIRVVLSDRGATFPLTQSNAGFWQASFKFNTIGLTVSQGPTNLALIATKLDGTSTQVIIPINISD